MDSNARIDRPHVGLAELPPPVLHERSRTPDRIAGATMAILALVLGLMAFVGLVFSMGGGGF